MSKTAVPEWIVASPLVILGRIAEEKGVDWPVILAKYNLTKADIACPDVRVDARSSLAIFNDVVETIGDDAALLDGYYKAPIGDGNVFDYVGLYSPTLRQGLTNWQRFYPARTNALILKFYEENGSGVLEWKIPDHLGSRGSFVYSFLPWITGRMEKMLGEDAHHICFEFAAPKPKGYSEFLKTYDNQAAFDQKANRVLIPGPYLDCHPQTADPGLFQIVQDAALQSLKSSDQIASSISRIKAVIGDQLKTGDCTMAAVAAELGLTKHALQHTLEQEGTSYRALLNTVRRSIAERYLVDTNLPIKEIAYLAGFSEISAFSRAVRKWFGKSPRALRQGAFQDKHSPN